jgi:rfaE bifunctional protein nucleotidyltransferase chain/domain/rfaE bifunctional protein kinase chain/domain
VSLLSNLDNGHLEAWAATLVEAMAGGSRLLVAGNGGSAAEAQHLTAELVGRFRTEKRPLPALALHADTSIVTALGNDYGFESVFARQVVAHGRPGDILLVLSTSGASRNILSAVTAAHDIGMTTWALTGPAPNPLSRLATDFIAIPSGSAANVQECHLVAVHILAAGVEEALARRSMASGIGAGTPAHVERELRTVRLTVVGDALLDEDIHGTANRISPEAPVAVIGELATSRRPGGAALAAVLAAQEGHQVTLVTAFTEDEAGRFLADQLTACGVCMINLGGCGPPATKTRIRSQGQTLLMLDGATEREPPGAWCDAADGAVAGAQAVLVADYGRGLTSAADVRAAIARVVGRVPVVWDPHPRGPAPVPGITVATPNGREAHHFAQGPGSSRIDRDIECARRLVESWRVGYVTVTRGAEGAVLIGDSLSAPLVVAAPFESPADGLGAGDKLAGVLAAALGAGVAVPEAVRHAVGAATRHVANVRGRAHAGGHEGGLGYRQVVARVRAVGGLVVATAGCFDLVHRGHVALLEQARRLGDCLVVCVNSDASVRRLKGEPRPLVGAEDRAGVLSALACVDAVVVFDEDTPARILGEIRPDVYVKGGDYAIEELLERVTVEAGGGRVVLVPYLDGRSTTWLIQRAQLGT